MYKRYRVMPYITIILLVTAVMCLLNFQTFVYSLNKDQYKGVQANITNQSYDGLTALIPKISVQYRYKSTDYEQNFLFYNIWIFNNQNIGDKVTVEVNKASPKNIIYVHDFWDSTVNKILVIVNFICCVIILNNIRRLIPQYVRKRFTRKAKQEARREIRKEANEKSIETGKGTGKV